MTDIQIDSFHIEYSTPATGRAGRLGYKTHNIVTSLDDIPEDFRSVGVICVRVDNYNGAASLASRFPKYCKAIVRGYYKAEGFNGWITRCIVEPDQDLRDDMFMFEVSFGFDMQTETGVTGSRNETAEKRFFKVMSILKSL